MRHLALLLTIFFIANLTVAQSYTVTVTPKERVVDDVPHKGMAIILNMDHKEVEKLWKKKMRDFDGKSSRMKGATLLEDAEISDISDNPIRIISNVEKTKDGTEIWWAIDKGTEWVTQRSSSFGAASSILKNFGMEAYREAITEEIEDVEDEHEAVVKEYEKTVDDAEDMKEDIADNKEEIKKLQAENEQLEKDLESNQKEQEKLKKDISTMEKKVTETKAKLEMIK